MDFKMNDSLLEIGTNQQSDIQNERRGSQINKIEFPKIESDK